MHSSSTEWIDIEQLAEELGVPVRTIYAWRTRGAGPRAARFGKHLRFRRDDIEAWIGQRMDADNASGGVDMTAGKPGIEPGVS